MDFLSAFLKEIHVFLTKVQHSNCIDNFEFNISIKNGSSNMMLQHLLSGTEVDCVVLSDWQQHNLHDAALSLKNSLQHLITSVHTKEECCSSLNADNNYSHSYVMNSGQMKELESQDHAVVKSYCSQTYVDAMQQNPLQPTTKETEAANVLMNLSGKATERSHQEQKHIINSQDPDNASDHGVYNQPSANSLELLNNIGQKTMIIRNISEDYTNNTNLNENKNNTSVVTEFSNLLSKQSKELNVIERTTTLQKKQIFEQQKEHDIPVINKNALLPVTTQIICPICNHHCEDLVEVHEHILAQHNLCDETHLSSSHIQLQTSDALQEAVHFNTSQTSTEFQQVSFELNQGLHSKTLESPQVEQFSSPVSEMDDLFHKDKTVDLTKQNYEENDPQCMVSQICVNQESSSLNKKTIIPYEDIEPQNYSRQSTLGINNSKINKKNCKKKNNFTENFGVNSKDLPKVTNLIQSIDKNIHLVDANSINIEILGKAINDEGVYSKQSGSQPSGDYIEEYNTFNNIRETNNMSENIEDNNSQSMFFEKQGSITAKKKNSKEKLEKAVSNSSEIHNVSIYNNEIHTSVNLEEYHPENNHMVKQNNSKNKSMTKKKLQIPEKAIEPEFEIDKNIKTNAINLESFHDKQHPNQAEKSNKLLFQVVESSKRLKDKTRDALAMAVESSKIRVLDHRVSICICLGCTTGFNGAHLLRVHRCPGDHPLIATQDNSSVSLSESNYTFNGNPAHLNQENIWYFPDFFIRRVDNNTVSVEMIHSSSGRIFRLESDTDTEHLCQNMFVFKCPKCCTEHDSLDHFLKHLVEGPCVFRCTLCTLMYNTPEKVEAHRSSVHPSVADRTCPRCKQVFEKRHLRNKHLAIQCSQKVVCQICGAVLKNKYNLMVHMKSHSERGHVCTDCGKAFHRKSVLMHHMLKHQGHKPFECSTCSQRFSNKHHLQSHEDRHSGNRRHSCSYCDKRFYIKYDCDRHIKIHHLKSDINCDTSNYNSRLIAKEVPQFSQNTEQISNMVIEKSQKQRLSRVANVVIESNSFCKNNTESNKVWVGELKEETKIYSKGSESEKKGYNLANNIANVIHRKFRRRASIDEQDDPDDPNEITRFEC